ncbi:NYN domain-containing protein [Streptomyces sp. NPDC127049]|uniref:NYN domain-containing protein n=1 Tax=Streptomyces sp. NPDC127049 TaxID=3347118 RepID=UPI0036661A12
MNDSSYGGRTGPRKAALFVDFDNIYLGLRDFDAEAADAFASRPAQWVNWLATAGTTGTDQPGGDRRFLVRNVYLNPVAFGRYRAVFTRSGFRAIDCPPLTTQGKNSADISMVLDIMDALVNPTRYDEFVILSGDADFTPVLQRLRAQDRWTTAVTAGMTAAALRANCDTLVTPEQLAAAALGVHESDGTPLGYVPAASFVAPRTPPTAQPSATSETGAASGAPGAPETSAAPGAEPAVVRPRAQGPAQPDADIAGVAEAIRSAVRATDQPLPSAAAAGAALRVAPGIKESNWHGTGSFRAFLTLHLTDLRYEPTAPGFVLDPERHSADGILGDERNRIAPLLQQVSTVTGVPPLSSQAYRALFTALAEDLQRNPFALYPTSKRVRDRTEDLGTPVPRAAVNYVIQGLKYTGQQLTPAVTADALAEAWANNTWALGTNAQMQLTEDDRRTIRGWIIGTDAETAAGEGAGTGEEPGTGAETVTGVTDGEAEGAGARVG